MPNFANIQHSLYHTGEAPPELEIEWDAHSFGKVSNISFDQRGNYAALYCDRSRVVVCTARNILLPQLIFFLPDDIKSDGYYCSSLFWSSDARYLVGNFYKRPRKKKLFEQVTVTAKSVMLIWDVAQQTLISNVMIPFLISSGLPLLSIGPYRTSNGLLANHFLLQIMRLEPGDQFRQFAFYTIETSLFYPVDEGVDEGFIAALDRLP